jgi:FKBP-type peptidyl-prolyl cis-trans isomerase FkpA
MLKQLLFGGSLVAALIFQSCKSGMEKTENGLKYKILADSAGPTGEDGGWIVFHFIMKNSKDSILRNTFKEGSPIGIPIGKPSFKGGLEEGFTMLSKGDSAQFFVNADSIFTKTFHTEVPKEVAKGSDLQFIVKVVNMYSKADVEKEMAKGKKSQEEAEAARQRLIAQDTATIVEYLKKNHIKAKRTINGVYYVVHKAVNGVNLNPGDSISVQYEGRLLNGTKFDSSYDRNAPFTLMVGMGQVIRGWDEGLMSLKRGEKATLYIPSGLAYGERGAGANIPPNSILIFDIEIQK